MSDPSPTEEEFSALRLLVRDQEIAYGPELEGVITRGWARWDRGDAVVTVRGHVAYLSELARRARSDEPGPWLS